MKSPDSPSSPQMPRATRPMRPPRPVVFVRYDEGGAAPARLEQLAAAFGARGLACRTIAARELGRVRDATVIFIGTAKFWHLVRARLAGNRTLLDVRALPACLRRPGSARLLDGAIFRNQRQRRDFDRPRWTSRVIYDAPEPGLSAHAVAPGEFHVACFASSAASEHYGRLRGVAFIASDPTRHAPQFNCHLALRGPGHAALYQPGTEVANAAACRAVLVTSRDESAVEMLGEDYPFFCASDRAAVEAALARARKRCGGPDWREALARLQKVSAKTRLEAIVEQHFEHFAALDGADHGGEAAPSAG